MDLNLSVMLSCSTWTQSHDSVQYEHHVSGATAAAAAATCTLIGY